jgi:hypothetical protein
MPAYSSTFEGPDLERLKRIARIHGMSETKLGPALKIAVQYYPFPDEKEKEKEVLDVKPQPKPPIDWSKGDPLPESLKEKEDRELSDALDDILGPLPKTETKNPFQDLFDASLKMLTEPKCPDSIRPWHYHAPSKFKNINN